MATKPLRFCRINSGFVPPFEALRYWVLGLAAPGEPPVDVQAGADGQVTQLTQQGWKIRYDRRAAWQLALAR